LKTIEPVLAGLGKTIRYSNEQRAAAITNMSSLKHRYGLFAHFFTFSMNDTDESLTIRFTFDHINNLDFPASSKVIIDGKEYGLGQVFVFFLFFVFVFFLFLNCLL
jgi:hypothetical protein